jgi:folate receptor
MAFGMTSKFSAYAAMVFTATLLLAPKHAGAYEDTCTPFHQIYADGTELCEKMWDGAFEVADDEAKGYTMWFFDAENNPNDAITRDLFGADTTVDKCHLNYFHKELPSPEGKDMQECHPWKNNACCDSSTVGSPDQINESYGSGFEWDRCGTMSQACERFFVMEACLYECEPNAGLFRKFNDSQTEHPEYNEWQIHKMPIKKSFCDSFYTACYDDYFCGKGNFWECEAHYKTNLAEEALKETEDRKAKDDKNKALTIGLSVAGGLAVVSVIASFYLVWNEKSGNPVFKPVETTATVA